MVVYYRIILCTILLQVQTNLLGATGLKLPCRAKRTEIRFPRVSNANGRVSLTTLDQTDTSSNTGSLLHVSLKWRRERLEVILFKHELATQTTHSEWTEGNVTFALATHRDCYYHGYVKGHRTSYVAISTCDGLAGYIQTDNELLYIQPSAETLAQTANDLHLAHVVYTCEPRLTSVPEPLWQVKSTAHHLKRTRRSATRPKYLEVMVVIDHSVVEQIGTKEKTQRYVMVLMNIANTVYQHHSLGLDIRVIVSKIVFLTKREQSQVLTPNDAYHTVNKFCYWSTANHASGMRAEYDVSVLITKETLGPSGYAPITGLCNPIRSCAAVREEGFSTGFIIAHEMAHVFGLFHDGHGNNCHGNRYRSAMMAAMVESKLNHFWWSPCSKRRMKEMIRFLHCLNNEPRNMVEGHYPLEAQSKFKPELGRPYSLDFQCRMEFGKYFGLCGIYAIDPCHALWCSRSSSPSMCRTKRAPPMSGTGCGHDRECLDQRCQYVGAQNPIDGKWGSWGAWSDCSSNCGVGIRHRSRACDRPAPAYDGKKCEGASRGWETCVNETCSSYTDQRKGECAIWDSLQIRYGTHNWQPFEGQNASSLCKQTCQSSYSRRRVVTIDVDVADGTPCSYTGNNSNICVEGECLEVGCDGVENSTKLEDRCGVCDGDGTACKIVNGTFNGKPKSKTAYYHVLTLPRGSRDILVEKMEKSNHFLALNDPRYGSYGLNGEKRQAASYRFVYVSAMFDYRRPTTEKNESITSPGPLRHPIKVMVYPNNVMKNVSVYFRYTVSKDDFTLEKDTYQWKFKEWSDCSVTCGNGHQTLLHKCVDKRNGADADDENCRFVKAPRKDQVRCTRAVCGVIDYNFALTNNFTECDAKCGETGLQRQHYFCERFHRMDKSFEPVDMARCKHLQPPHVTRNCKGPPCTESVKYQWLTTEAWSDCECEETATQTRNVTCQKITTKGAKSKHDSESVEESDVKYCKEASNMPETNRSCKGQPCRQIKFQWLAPDEWSECPCGDASKQTRNITCQVVTLQRTKSSQTTEKIEGTVEEKCNSLPEKPISSRYCKGEPCGKIQYKWIPAEHWSACPCGEESEQTRRVTCQKTILKGNKTEVEPADHVHCHDVPDKPATSQKCKEKPCKPKPTFRWNYSESYGPCFAPCDQKGQQTREVVCEQVEWSNDGKEQTKEQSDHYLCIDSPIPAEETRTCTGEPCPTTSPPPSWTYKWIPTDEWSECQAACSMSGVQSRIYQCEGRSSDGEQMEVTDEECEQNDLEPETKPCKGPMCPLQWSIGDWSPCTVTCGSGKRYRKVHCGDPDTDVDDIRCTGEPPATSRKCTMRACPKLKDETCEDLYSFCSTYKALRYRCRRSRFRRKCCKTCQKSDKSSEKRQNSKNKKRKGRQNSWYWWS